MRFYLKSDMGKIGERGRQMMKWNTLKNTSYPLHVWIFVWTLSDIILNYKLPVASFEHYREARVSVKNEKKDIYKNKLGLSCAKIRLT